MSMKLRLTTGSPRISLKNAVIICDGDSITNEARDLVNGVAVSKSGIAYPVQLRDHPEMSKFGVSTFNIGRGGQSVDAMKNGINNDILPKLKRKGNDIVIAWGSINSLSNTTIGGVNGTHVLLKDYCNLVRAQGVHVIVCTLLYSSKSYAPGEKVEQYNELIRNNWTTYADLMLDVKLIPQLHPVTSTYLPDGTHPNTLGHGVFVDNLVPVIKSLRRKR